jgi:RNA polymerase sigma-70 factor (ECF subfamily)
MTAGEARLVREAKRGSEAALGELFDRHFTTVWRAAYGVTWRPELADDIAQDVFVRAIASLRTFDEARPITPWLARIAVNRAIDVVRHEARLAELEEDPSTDDDAPDRDWELLAAVRHLSPDRRLVVVLRYWVNLKVREISEILDIPVGTVTSRLGRALEDLRQLLEARHV